MYCKLIACNVLLREIAHVASRSPTILDLEFTEKGEHDEPARLRGKVQAAIDAASASGRKYDAILLAYGLCGNALAEIEARGTRLILPRAHDCCTIFLGSRLRFKEHFQDNPSRPFSTAGYMERGDDYLRTSNEGRRIGLDKSYDEYVRLYGEENARYIMESLAPAREIGKEQELVYIDVPETAGLGYAERCRAKAEADGKTFRLLKGDIRLIRGLIDGPWPEDEYLVVEPGRKVEPIYDWEEVIRAV